MSANCGARRSRPLLGTLVEIRVSAHRQAERAVAHAFAAIERVHRAMSAQESTSDIARLRSGHTFALDPWTRRVRDRAEEIRLATDGLFDCLACGYSLDGIAKGFAVDCAVEALQSAGIRSGLVNAGGDLRIFGDAFEDVYVRSPQRPDRLTHIGKVRDAAVATSSARLLIDPWRRLGAARAAGATVIATDCMTADALTKPCLLEPADAPQVAARFCAHALILGGHG
jgi:thiamine biosynthesis lipoprotein